MDFTVEQNKVEKKERNFKGLRLRIVGIQKKDANVKSAGPTCKVTW
jgi:hypothetical protein